MLYRTSDGQAVVLEDRDVHRPYPLSLGRVEDDLIVSSYTGFAYAADGTCVRVPTQTEVPYDARVRAFPVREQDGLVWVWFAEAGLADLRKPPRAPWLVDDRVVDARQRVDHRRQLPAAARELRRHHPRGRRRPRASRRRC